MVAALPLSKLVGLLIKTLSKPVAKRIKHECSRSEVTQGALVSIGQATHQITSRLTIWSNGYKVRNVKPLESEEALKNGAELLGEGLIFFIGGAVVVWEYNNSKQKERTKEEKRHSEMQREADELQHKFHILDVRLRALEKVVKTNSESILNIGGARYIEPKEAHDRFIDMPLSIPKSPVDKGADESRRKDAGTENLKRHEKLDWWTWMKSSFRWGSGTEDASMNLNNIGGQSKEKVGQNKDEEKEEIQSKR